MKKTGKCQVETRLTIDREDQDDIDVTIIGTYSPGLKGRRTLSNGDPGYPDEPSEAEILSVTVDGVKFELTDSEVDKAIAALIKKAETREED